MYEVKAQQTQNSDLIVYSASVNEDRLNPNDTFEVAGIIYSPDTSLPPAFSMSALSFDGIDDYIEVNPFQGIGPNTPFTIEFWINREQIPSSNYEGYLLLRSATSTVAMIRGDQNGVLWFSVPGRNMGIRSKFIPIDSLIHITFVYWQENGTWYVQGYSNGVERTVAYSADANPNGPKQLQILFPNSNYGNVIIDEVRIYNRALSSEEISEHFQSIYENELNLVLHLDFDGDYTDKSGSGNHGTNYGATWTDGFTNIDVNIELGQTLKRTIGIINSSDGSFSIPLIAESDVGLYSYNVYATNDGNSLQNQTVNLVVDRFKVMDMSVDSTRRDIETNGTINVLLHYEHDNTPVTTGFFMLNGVNLTHKGSGVWQTTTSESVVKAITYDSITGSGDTYGLNTVNMNNQTVTIIWDLLDLKLEVSPDEWPYQGETISLNLAITRQYDNSPVTDFIINLTKDDIIWINDLTVSSTTDIEEEAVSHAYNCTNIVDNTYGLTAWISTPVTVTWEKTGEPPPEPEDLRQMVYIDPITLTVMFAIFTWIVIILSAMLILRR